MLLISVNRSILCFVLNKIEIKKANPPIESGFQLDELKDLNIVVGKNNSGKTRFFESIEKKYEQEALTVVYIPANQVNPQDDYFKTSSASSALIAILALLLEDDISLSNHKDVEKKIEGVFNLACQKFEEMTGQSDCGLNVEQTGKLNKAEIIKSLIKSVSTNLKDADGKLIKLERMGQGYQRMFIASLLQSHADKRSDGKDGKEVLILFEEPELFLHPELKRDVNKSLKKISRLDNHQIIISTHDPYFLWSNMDDEGTALYSFEVGEDRKTTVSAKNVGLGVEDEMLHISLFSKLIEKMKDENMPCGLGISDMKKTSDALIKKIPHGGDLPEKKKYTYDGKSHEVILPIYIRNAIHHPENTANVYTSEELAESIKDLNRLLSLFL